MAPPSPATNSARSCPDQVRSGATVDGVQVGQLEVGRNILPVDVPSEFVHFQSHLRPVSRVRRRADGPYACFDFRIYRGEIYLWAVGAMSGVSSAHRVTRIAVLYQQASEGRRVRD